MEITEQIRAALDKGDYALGLYLDLSKAFDTVNHKILLKKLECYGVRGIVLDWFSSYLSDRKQYTVVNKTKSDPNDINTGVPQGSVLGPLLFLIYVNDISTVTKGSNDKIMLFADDSNAFVINKDLNILIRNSTTLFAKIKNWFSANKLTINIDKTNFSIFHSPRKKVPNEYNILKLGNINIQRVECVRYLGILLDDHLNWISHINFLCSKLTQILSAFKLIKNLIPYQYRQQLYYGFCYSRISYGIEVYGTASQRSI